jgi:hypothetical protein
MCGQRALCSVTNISGWATVDPISTRDPGGVDTDGQCTGFDADHGILRAKYGARPRSQRSSRLVFRIPDDDRDRDAALRGECGAGQGGQGFG